MSKHVEDKGGSNKFVGLVILLLIIAFFVGPRIMSNLGITSTPLMRQIEDIQTRVGKDRFEQIINSMVPVGYAAMCIKTAGSNSEIVQAAEQFNLRNQVKAAELVRALKDNNILSVSDKENIDKYAYNTVVSGLKSGTVSCSTLATELASGKWDLR